MEIYGKGLMVIAFTLSAVLAQDKVPVLRSCYELKLAGYSTDGEYKVDPDGPGQGLPPFVIYCDLTNEDGPTSLVEHDQMFHGIVPNGFEDAGEFRIPVTYEHGASIEQVSKLADISANCSQYLRVDCHHITMWYHDEPWGYWVSREGSTMPNWGTPTGTRGCECSLDQSCDDPEHQTCNCDANDEDWRKDDGDVTDKATLPVTELRFGDTGSDKEKVVYKVGPLKCLGMEERSVPSSCDGWAAAGFYGEGDYLIQPTGGRAEVRRCNEQYLTSPPPVLRSCEELRLAGYTTDGEYLIDPDFSSSGYRPFVVFCDMATGTTIVKHDRQGPLLSNGFNSKGEHRLVVHYGEVPVQQVIALVDASENCQQYIGAQCHDSHIFSGHRTRSVYTWWVSRNGTKMTNWGTPTGVEGCACSLTLDCDRRNNICNCDSNDDVWRQDDGYLTDKDTLPVTELRIGDTGGSDEVALYNLGELKCTGIGAKVYTSCASLQEDGISGGGQYLIDSDGTEGSNEPSVVMCEGTNEIISKVVNCPNVTRLVPQIVTVISGDKSLATQSPKGSGGSQGTGAQCPKRCPETTDKQRNPDKNKAFSSSQTGSQVMSASALNFVVVGVILLLLIIIIVLVLVVLQWKKLKTMQHMALSAPNGTVECTKAGEKNLTESPDSFSNVQFFNSRVEAPKTNEYAQTPLI